MVFGGPKDAGGELEVADVADDLADLGFGDAGDGKHVAKGPVVLTDAAYYGEVEGGVAMVAGVVDAVDEGGAKLRAGGGLAMALGAVGVEDGFALPGGFGELGQGGDWLLPGVVTGAGCGGLTAGDEGNDYEK